MPNPYDRETMRARYAELCERRDAIRAVSEPLRAARDAVHAEFEGRIQPMNAEILAAEEGLFDIEREIATLSRAV